MLGCADRCPHPPLRLGVNIDHVATIRNARGGRASRSGARGASSRSRPAPTASPRICARTAATSATTTWRGSRPRSAKPLNFEMAATAEMLRDRAATQAARGLPGAGAARGAHHRRRPRRGRPAQRAGAVHRAAERRRHPGVAVHRRRPAADRDGGEAGRAGDRNPHRRLVRCGRRRPHGEGRGRMAAHRRRARSWRGRPASKSMPATGSIMRPPRRSRRLPEIVELNIGHFLIGEAVFVGLAETVRDDARGDGSRPRASRCKMRDGMIIGIGSDLIDIRRIAKVIERHGDRFLDRIFTDVERAKAERRAKNEKMVVATYAKRFAAKEACAKALGTGIRQRRVVARHGRGQPAGRPADHEADRRGAEPGSRR